MNTKSERFEMRLDQPTLERIDNWRGSQIDFPSRAEAIRRMVEESSLINQDVSISDGEKIIITMLCELYKSLKIKGEMEPNFIQEVIYGGHYWALKWEYSGLFHEHKDTQKALTEVVDILDMWSFLEEGYEKLSAKEKKLVLEKIEHTQVQFVGFDGNNETEHMGIARFLIDKMGRFERFKGRYLNSHCPIIRNYRQMLKVFEPIRQTLIGRSLFSEEIISIMVERFYKP